MMPVQCQTDRQADRPRALTSFTCKPPAPRAEARQARGPTREPNRPSDPGRLIQLSCRCTENDRCAIGRPGETVLRRVLTREAQTLPARSTTLIHPRGLLQESLSHSFTVGDTLTADLSVSRTASSDGTRSRSPTSCTPSSCRQEPIRPRFAHERARAPPIQPANLPSHSARTDNEGSSPINNRTLPACQSVPLPIVGNQKCL